MARGGMGRGSAALGLWTAFAGSKTDFSRMTKLVSVGVADSGINPRHRQIGAVAGGVGVHVRDGDIEIGDDWVDQLGHGTAVAAAIRGHAPDAALYSIRIFRRRLVAHVEALLYAIEWALAHELDMLNLSLARTEQEKEKELTDACEKATEAGLILVAARADSLPGSLANVIAVGGDPDIDVRQMRFEGGVFFASSWAWPLGELPKERNFHGVSLAVAHVTGIAASALASGVPKAGIEAALRVRCEKIEG